jgi:ComF family protein
VNNWSGIIQDWLYPPTCLLCGDPGTAGRDLCRPCAESLPYNLTPCPRCGLTLSVSQTVDCGRCQRHPPAFDATFAPFRYEEPVRHLIHALKFRANYPSARLLGQLMAEALTGVKNKPALLLPVPLHPSRYRERGFNQAAEVARTLSRQLHIPLDPYCCARARATQPQAELPAKERLRNLKKAFRIIAAPRASHVAIVDDVVTTGTTVNELAKVLKAAGVERIDVWACARA